MLVRSKLVAALLPNIKFHLWLIWLQTLVVINSESCQTLFPSFCTQPSEVAVLFYLNQSRCPFFWQVGNSDLQLCTGINSYALFLIRDQRKIERLSKEMTAALPIQLKISVHVKKWLITVWNLQSTKTFDPVCAVLKDQHKLCLSAASRACPLILQSKTLIVFLNSLMEGLPYDQQGLELGLKFEFCSLTNLLLRSLNPRVICVDFKFFLG